MKKLTHQQAAWLDMILQSDPAQVIDPGLMARLLSEHLSMVLMDDFVRSKAVLRLTRAWRDAMILHMREQEKRWEAQTAASIIAKLRPPAPRMEPCHEQSEATLPIACSDSQ